MFDNCRTPGTISGLQAPASSLSCALPLDFRHPCSLLMVTPGHVKSDDEHRKEICEVGRWLHQLRYVASTDGNISVRLDDRRILATPTAVSKGMMQPDDLIVVDYEGKRLLGRRNVSSEIAMHLLIYKRRPNVNAVVHAHPPVATGYAAAGLPLNKALISEVVLSLGCIPIAQYGTPGTPELSEALAGLVPHYDAILMANHGVVTFSEDLLQAYFKMETVEHFARISLVTELLGRQVLLSQADVDKLMEARRRYGITSEFPRSEVCPVTDGVHEIRAGGAAAPGGGATHAHHQGCGCHTGDKIVLTREELEALIDEAVRSLKVK